jgi:hypothetical protein
MVTVVALVATTVNVEVFPATIEDGLAEMVTVGAVGVVVVPVPAPTVPQPARTRNSENIIARGESIEWRGRETRTFMMVLSFLNLQVSDDGSSKSSKTNATKQENLCRPAVLLDGVSIASY